MTEEPLFLDIEMSIVPALEAWAAFASTRGKTMEDILRKTMRFAVDYAIKKTKKGDRARIVGDLTRLVHEYKGTRKNLKSKTAEKYRGTLAAAIVWRLNYRQAQTLAVNRSPAFYSTVASFVSGRAYATNLHAAGWKPAQRDLHASPGGARLPSFRKQPPGSVPRMTITDTLAEIIVENWASAAAVPGRPAPLGAAGIIGPVLDEILPDLERTFTKFLAQDMLRAATHAGFHTAA